MHTGVVNSRERCGTDQQNLVEELYISILFILSLTVLTLMGSDDFKPLRISHISGF